MPQNHQIVANPCMVAADSEVSATEVLADGGVEKGLFRTITPYARVEHREHGRIGRIMVFDLWLVSS